MNLRSYFPFLSWIPQYRRHDLSSDLMAGLVVWVLLVPQGMAYAMLAGVAPIYGLYAGLVPLFLYGLLGTSRQLSIGPVAISSLLVLAGISQVAVPGTKVYLELVILAGLLIGLFQLLMGFMRLGFLVNFLSQPVVQGFSMGAAVIIAISQFKYLFGMEIPRSDHIADTLFYVIQHPSAIHWPTFAFCMGGIILMIILRKINRRIPGALILLILAIILVRILDLSAQGIAIVGTVPAGLPAFAVPVCTWEMIELVMPTVLTVSIIGVVESISIAKVLEAKYQSHQVRADQELFALGISKIIGVFFQAIPTSGSFSRSAVNNEVGGRTGLSSIVTALLMALTLLFLTPIFYYLPNAVLASIILMAVWGLFDYQEALYLWKTHRQDFYMMLVTFLVTLFIGIEEGVLAGVILSLFLVLFRSARPHIAVLGQIPKTKSYRNISRFPEALQSKELLILRFDAQLYFGNVTAFKDRIKIEVAQRLPDLQLLILDASSIHEMDSSGLAALQEVVNSLKRKEIDFYICGVIGPVRDLLHQSGVAEHIGAQNQFLYVHDAVRHFQTTADDHSNWNKHALQNNIKRSDP